MKARCFRERRSRKVLVEDVILKAEPRNVKGKQVKQQRRLGKLPAVLYGRRVEPISVWLDLHNANLTLDRLSQSTLITIDLEGQQHLTLVREKQRNFLTGSLLHVDFMVVSATETIRANVYLDLFGEAPAVKNFNGIVFPNLDSLEVEALPRNLPSSIRVDISGLATIGAAIHVKDLDVPDGVTVLDDPEEIVVVVTAVQEEKEPEVAAVEEEPEVIEKGKKEEEEEAE